MGELGPPMRDDEERPLPVLASETRVLEPRRELPLATPALAAAGGFVAGFVTFVLTRIVRRHGRLPLVRRRARPVEIAASRSFLVDVHFLKR